MVKQEIKEYGVFVLGGSIGGFDIGFWIKNFNGRNGKLVESFDTREEAVDYAKRMRKLLTKGEKSYYKLTYRSGLTQGIEQIK